LQILLAGQPNLRDTIASPELEQFRQRIAVSYHLRPLAAPETEAYINFRLEHASLGQPLRFPSDAASLIHEVTGGVPRLINVLCDAALVFGYAEERRAIDREMIDEVITELEETGLVRRPQPSERAAAAAAAAATPVLPKPAPAVAAPAPPPQPTPYVPASAVAAVTPARSSVAAAPAAAASAPQVPHEPSPAKETPVPPAPSTATIAPATQSPFGTRLTPPDTLWPRPAAAPASAPGQPSLGSPNTAARPTVQPSAVNSAASVQTAPIAPPPAGITADARPDRDRSLAAVRDAAVQATQLASTREQLAAEREGLSRRQRDLAAKEQALAERERQMAEQRRIMGEEYRLLRQARPATSPTSPGGGARPPIAAGMRHDLRTARELTFWQRVFRLFTWGHAVRS